MAVEFIRKDAAAVYGRIKPAGKALGLHKSGNGLLGASETVRRTVRNHLDPSNFNQLTAAFRRTAPPVG